MFTGSGQLVTLKSGDFEEGLSVVKGSLKQFFILPPRRTFNLRFQVLFYLLFYPFHYINCFLQAEGIGKVEFDKSQGRLTLFDQAGHVALSYHKPYFNDASNSNKKADIIWNPANNELIVSYFSSPTPHSKLILATTQGLR